MLASQPSAHIIRFGVFELDVAAGELRRDGLRVKLQNQPVRVLTLLLKRAGEVVPRDDFRKQIWPADTFVDFDRGLSTAINKIREALGDSADNPRFVETAPRRGYRFIAPVEGDNTGESVLEPPTSAPNTQQDVGGPRVKKHARLWVAAAVLAACAFGLLARDLFRAESGKIAGERAVRKFRFRADGAEWPAISPDGTMIAYVQSGRLWIRDLHRFEPREIADTQGASRPFWSPDSRFVGYGAGKPMKKVSARGGPSTTICELPLVAGFGGAAWSEAGSIVFAMGRSGLFEVSAQGGRPRSLLELEGEYEWVYAPIFIGDSQTVLFLAKNSSANQTEIVALADDRQRSTLQQVDGGDARLGRLTFSSPAHVLYDGVGSEAGPRIWALPLNRSRLAPGEGSFPAVEGASYPSVADDGTLVYLSRIKPTYNELAWVNRAGEVQAIVGEPSEPMRRPAISPDGRKIAVTIRERGNDDIWIYDRVRGTKVRLTFDPGRDVAPAWSPSGNRIAFNAERNGERGIYVKAADGSGEAQLLVGGPRPPIVPGWSLDGRYLLFSVSVPGPNYDLWYAVLDGSPKPQAFLESPFTEWEAKPSPDGRYVAYQSDESGRREIYVRTFPKGQGKWQVSANGGIQPRWSRRGSEMFYVENNQLMVVDVETAAAFHPGRPRPLFHGDKIGMRFDASYGGAAPLYDVAPDGEHFVVVRPVEGSAQTYISVVENWYEEFRHRKPE